MGQLSTAGEDVVQFIRTEMPPAVSLTDPAALDAARARWHHLRAELRKAYNRVGLFGSDAVRQTGVQIWRTARNGLDGVFATFGRAAGPPENDLAEALRTIASQLGHAGGPYMQACRQDLQGGEHEPVLGELCEAPIRSRRS